MTLDDSRFTSHAPRLTPHVSRSTFHAARLTIPPVSGRLTLDPALVLDARRAVWLPLARVLAVADTHLGYAWVQRARGHLLPLGPPDDTLDRLGSLVRDYQPDRLVILGDVVHAAREVPGLSEALAAVEQLVPGRVTFVLGNHDRCLAECLVKWGIGAACTTELNVPGFQLLHGDREPGPLPPGARRLSGHEHPSVVLGDGLATQLKVPAFIIGRHGIVLPAFSSWAAGGVIGRGGFMGPVAAGIGIESRVACLGPRLLRLP